MGQDIINQLIGRANRNGDVYFNTENILAVIAYFVVGWVISSIIVNMLISRKQEKLVSLTPTLKAFEYVMGSGTEYIIHKGTTLASAVADGQGA